jgi:hypothetical protein
MRYASFSRKGIARQQDSVWSFKAKCGWGANAVVDVRYVRGSAVHQRSYRRPMALK